MTQPDVFHLNLNQFADPCASGRKKANHEIPEQFIVLFQTGLKIFIVGLADNIFQKGLDLYAGDTFILGVSEGTQPIYKAAEKSICQFFTGGYGYENQ